jgi:hypothetical protein
METIIKHGSIPKAVCIPKFDITEFIANFSNMAGMGEIDSDGLVVLMKEVGEILTSDTPDQPHPMLDETVNYLIARNVTFKQFVVFKQYLIKGLDSHLRQIEILRAAWREHADPYLRYIYDDALLTIIFNPVYPTRDFSGILLREIEEARLNNEFIPYKYLRVLGMC